MKTRAIAIAAFLMLALLPPWVAAEEEIKAETPAAESESEPEAPTYVFPKIDPELTLTGGFRYLHFDGSRRVEEFEYFQNSPYFGIEFRAVPFPHRLHLDFSYRNERDYDGDLTYAYKDLVAMRLQNSTLFHNLDNLLIGRTFATGVDAQSANTRDAGKDYGIMVGITNASLRLKLPDFPAHLYFEENYIRKSGGMQQRFIGAAATPGTRRRISDDRAVDTHTSVFTVGANSHLGPVEVDFAHSEKRYSVGDDQSMLYDYAAGTPRPGGGWYFHNVIPEFKGHTDTLKVHTTHTGKVFANATFAWNSRENSFSNAKADTFFGTGNVVWMPMPALTFYLKYRHFERDLDNPDSLRVVNPVAGSSYVVNFIRDSISSQSNLVSGTVRVRPVKGVLVKAEYSYEDIRRAGGDDWELPDATQRQRVTLTADLRVIKGLSLNAKYVRRDNNHPSTNADPDTGDEFSVSAAAMPLPWLTAMASYSIIDEDRDKYHFLVSSGTLEGHDRSVKREQLHGVLSITPLPKFSLSVSGAHFTDNITQDIIVGSGTYVTDRQVPYKIKSTNFSLDAAYSPVKALFLNGGVSYTMSKGKFFPSSSLPASSVSITEFSQLKTREMVFSGSAEFRFAHGMSVGAQYKYATLNDLYDNPYDDIKDGRAHVMLLTLTKKW